jgi:hypothetical protein
VVGEMKGLSLRNYPRVLADLRGQRTVNDMLALLPSDLRGALTGGVIMASGWYPVAWKCALHEAGKRATGEANLAWMMGHEMTVRDLRGVYRAFVRVVSPRFVLSLGAQLFSSYLRPGNMRVLESRKGFVRVAFDGCQGFSRDLWQDVLGGCEGALSVAGARLIRLHVEAGARDGDTTARAVAWWNNEVNESKTGEFVAHDESP